MTRHERRAVAAAGELFDRAGWRWRTEMRSRHLILIVTPPDGVAVNIIITTPREGAGVFLAAVHARRLLRKHNVNG